MFIQHRDFNTVQLDRFRAAQRASYAILEQVGAELRPGMTEHQATAKLTRAYRELGVKSFFHLPVALFGERTALPGKWRNANFWPTRRRLKDGDAVILDCSPLIDGYLVDTSYSTRIGDNPVHQQMMLDLKGFRGFIEGRVKEGASLKAIAEETDARIRAMGYENRHQAHLEEVLGHRVIHVRAPTPGWVYKKGFDIQTLAWFALHTVGANKGWWRFSPNWNTKPSSDHPPWDGLWAVEPHLGKDGVGAKWEELLVVQDGEVFWLDDDTPHMRWWTANGA